MTPTPIAEIFRQQATQCQALGSPFTAQLLRVVADQMQTECAVLAHLRSWPGDARGRADSVPLRLAGGLHALVLQGDCDGLIAAYPPHQQGDAALWSAIHSALLTHETFLLDWLASPPQTNEVRRCATIIPAAMHVAAQFNLPFTLSELGASGGLNLNFDRFAVQAGRQRLGPADAALLLDPDWQGQQPTAADITVAERRGVDLNPLTSREDARRLRAYLWADQPHRMTLTNAALSCPTPRVDKGDARDWLERRLARRTEGTIHMVYHTVAWQYFPKDTQAACTALIEAAGKAATGSAPLARFGMEVDERPLPGAALTLRIWPDNRTIDLGRADFHGRWVNWEPKELPK